MPAIAIVAAILLRDTEPCSTEPRREPMRDAFQRCGRRRAEYFTGEEGIASPDHPRAALRGRIAWNATDSSAR